MIILDTNVISELMKSQGSTIVYQFVMSLILEDVELL